MKAFVVEHYGKDGLHAADVPRPQPGPRDVLVKVSAASINPLDKLVRDGEFKQLLKYKPPFVINPLDKLVRDGEFKQLLKYKPPFVLGHDVAGTVTSVGSAVRGFNVGDEIYARPGDLRIGTFAEYIAIDEDDVALKPATLTMAEAAAVPLVALAAWQILVERAGIGPGSKVLVHGGAGGLGSTVIQLAKHLGAHVATTARGSVEDLVRSLGADVVIDYTQQDFSTVLSGYDLVVDGIGGNNLMKSLSVLTPGGLALGVAGPPDAAFARQLGAPRAFEAVLSFLSRKVRWAARKAGVRYSFFFMRASGEQLTHLADLYNTGALHPVIDTVFAFDETPQAMAYVEDGKTKAGKAVLSLD